LIDTILLANLPFPFDYPFLNPSFKGIFTGGTFVKYSSQGKLKKKRGFGVGFNMEVKY